jgi:small subunit ribosomal protein S3
MVIGKSGKTIKKLTSDVKQFQLDNPQIEVKEVEKPELNAQMMANRLASSLERGWYFRKAGNSTLQQIMDAGALGCEVILAGKLTGPRKRTQKFIEGYIKHSGKAAEEIVDRGFAVAKRKLGIIGVKVRIVPPGVTLPDYFVLKSELEEAALAETDESGEAEKQDRGEEIVEELLGEDVKTEDAAKDEQPPMEMVTELDKAVEAAVTDKDEKGKESDDGKDARPVEDDKPAVEKAVEDKKPAVKKKSKSKKTKDKDKTKEESPSMDTEGGD